MHAIIAGIRDAFISWAVKRARYPQPVVTFDGQDLFTRWAFFRRDEWSDSWWNEHREAHPLRPNRLPWWLPFNMFLHHWAPTEGFDEDLHDHPRWSVTVMLKGRIIERTPWGQRVLRPGAMVVRSRKYIHGFSLDPAYKGDIWTLFIVGRRKHRQNTFAVTPR